MARAHFGGLTFVVLALNLTVLAQSLPAQGGTLPPLAGEPLTVPSRAPQKQATGDRSLTCTLYNLADLGDLGVEPGLSQWIAETIPEVVRPDSWEQAGGKGKLRYFFPRKIMLVYQSPTVQAEVRAFLNNVRKTLSKEQENASAATKRASGSGVVAAKYSEPALLGSAPATAPKTVPCATAPSAAFYPIPAPRSQPKHLFHFIIRYEGAGVIDANVASLAKAMAGANKQETGNSAAQIFGSALGTGTGLTPTSATNPVYGSPPAGSPPVATPAPSSSTLTPTSAPKKATSPAEEGESVGRPTLVPGATPSPETGPKKEKKAGSKKGRKARIPEIYIN